MQEFKPFTYKRVVGRKTRSHSRHTINEPILSRSGKRFYKPTCVYKNSINRRKFTKGYASPPKAWPAHLSWPDDILKALYYQPTISETTPKPTPKKRASRSKAKCTPRLSSQIQASPPPLPRLMARIADCHGIDCPKPYTQTRDPAKLCTCTTAPWDAHQNAVWCTANIEIKFKSAALGCCIVSRSDFSKGTVLGEYVGEIVPAMDNDWSPYLMNLDMQVIGENEECVNLGYVDSLRMGNWTRFMNHSCNPNVNYGTMRVGSEARLACVAVKDIKKGDELTANYGEQWWATMKDRGGNCGCGEKGCEYSDGDQTDGSQTK